MKKQVICLIFVMSILLSGCSFFSARIKDPVVFYYLCDSYQEDLCCVIVSEEREASGHTGDLSYLLALYMMGPTNDEHIMPLPVGTRIRVQSTDGHIVLELYDMPKAISDAELSLASACLTMTCFEISEAKDVTIRCGERETVMDRSKLILYDTSSETTPTEESQ